MKPNRWLRSLQAGKAARERATELGRPQYLRYERRAEKHFLDAFGHASECDEPNDAAREALEQLFWLYRYHGSYAGTEWVCRQLLLLTPADSVGGTFGRLNLMQELAIACRVLRKDEDADSLVLDCLALAEREPGADSAQLLRAVWQAGMHFGAQGDRAKLALPYWERAAELAGHLAVTDPTAARPFKRAGNELAACYAALGQHDKAEATWLNVLARLEQDKQSDRRLVEHGIGFASRELAKSLRAQGKLHEAEAAWRRALAAFQTGPSLMHVYWISRDLASVCLETGRRSEADALYTRALEERERFTIRHSPQLSEHENQLVLNELRRDADVHGLAALVSDHVRLLESEGRVLEATSLCESVIEILSTPLSEAELARRAAMRLPERDLSQDEAELRVTEQYGSLLRLAGRDADARAAEQQALSLREVVRKERRADRRRISDRLRRAKARQRTEPPFLAAGAG